MKKKFIQLSFLSDEGKVQCYGRPCARSFSEYARKNNIAVDYTDCDFDKYILGRTWDAPNEPQKGEI